MDESLFDVVLIIQVMLLVSLYFLLARTRIC